MAQVLIALPQTGTVCSILVAVTACRGCDATLGQRRERGGNGKASRVFASPEVLFGETR